MNPTADDFRRLREEIVGEIRELRQALEAGYQRKDVAQAENNATSIQIAGLEDEQHIIHKRIDRMQDAASANRRLIIASFIAPIIVGIVVALLLSASGVHR